MVVGCLRLLGCFARSICQTIQLVKGSYCMHSEAITENSAIEKISTLLTEKYGERGERAGEFLRQWLSGEMPFAYPEIATKCLDEKRLGLLFDSFWQVLPFGTGGRRGRVGYGANRLNPTTVAMTIQGHCQYLRRAARNEGK